MGEWKVQSTPAIPIAGVITYYSIFRLIDENVTDTSANREYYRAEDKQFMTMRKLEAQDMADKLNQTEEFAKASALNAQIINSARMAQQNIYDMATGFKQMRDEKLYIALGYKNFGDYCEKETGMSRQNVYKYINVVEKLPKEFVAPCDNKKQLGLQKLTLLATISEQQRETIVETVDLESTTVKELKEQIKSLQTENTKHNEDVKAKQCYIDKLEK